MEQYIIKGGIALHGDVEIGGAKNAALGILAAAIMTDDEVLIENLPDVRDVNVMLEAMSQIGVKVDRLTPHAVMQKDEMPLVAPTLLRRASPSACTTSSPGGASMSGCATPMSYARNFHMPEPEIVDPSSRYQWSVSTRPVMDGIPLPFCARMTVFV